MPLVPVSWSPSSLATTDPRDDPNNPYGYIPTLWICILFVVLYSISTGEYFCLSRLFPILTVNLKIAIHLSQSIMYRMWFLIPSACFGGALEILGWSARIWSIKNIDLSTPFTIQYACLPRRQSPLRSNFSHQNYCHYHWPNPTPGSQLCHLRSYFEAIGRRL
jgi:hypothetical protein